MSASAAKHDQLVELLLRPNGCCVLGNFVVAEVTRKPSPTALKVQGNDVISAVIMGAARFRIDLDAADLEPVNCAGHAVFSRGQISTSTDPMIQHAIIIMKPVLNEPVR